MSILSTFQRWRRDLMIMSAAARKLGKAATMRAIQAVGLGMRKTDLLKRYDFYRQGPEKAPFVKTTKKGAFITQGNYIESDDWMRKRYRYTVVTNVYFHDTGKMSPFQTKITSDRPLRVYEQEQRAREAINVMLYDESDHFVSQHPYKAEHRQGDPWD